MLKRVISSLCLLVLMITGLTAVVAVPASAGLTANRTCKNFWTGDHHRMLSVCARVWTSDSGTRQIRGVVEMHTYILVDGHWMDSKSQSITIKDALLTVVNAAKEEVGYVSYGTENSTSSCRVNSPASSQISCSVPNTARVAFYSAAWTGVSPYFTNHVYWVTWRDDAGVPHSVDSDDASYPDQLPLMFRNW